MKNYLAAGAVMLTALCVSLGFAPGAGAQDAASAKAFLVGLYQTYGGKVETDSPGNYRVTHALAPGIFEPGLAAALREMNGLNEGYPDMIGLDPLCGCNGHDPMTADVTVTRATATTAHARAALHQRSPYGNYDSTTEIDLVLTGGAWRIHDIDGYLRQDVMAALDMMKAGPASSHPPAADTADEARVRTLLQSIYAHYARGADNERDWYPTGAKQRGAYFDADMVAFMARDDVERNGEVGALDADPFCGCQDYGPLKATVAVAQRGPDRVMATVILGAPGGKKLWFDVRRSGGQWRIHDITGPNMPSLRLVFQGPVAAGQ